MTAAYLKTVVRAGYTGFIELYDVKVWFWLSEPSDEAPDSVLEAHEAVDMALSEAWATVCQ